MATMLLLRWMVSSGDDSLGGDELETGLVDAFWYGRREAMMRTLKIRENLVTLSGHGGVER